MGCGCSLLFSRTNSSNKIVVTEAHSVSRINVGGIPTFDDATQLLDSPVESDVGSSAVGSLSTRVNSNQHSPALLSSPVPPPAEPSFERCCLGTLSESGDSLLEAESGVLKQFGGSHVVVISRLTSDTGEDFLSQRLITLQSAELHRSVVAFCGGRLLRFVGLRGLMLFSTAADAVNACLSLWEYFRQFNERRLPTDRLRFRAGCAAGHVLLVPDATGQRTATVVGDAAAVAARLAEPSLAAHGVLVASAVFEAVSDAVKLNLLFLNDSIDFHGSRLRFVRITDFSDVPSLTGESEINALLFSQHPPQLPESEALLDDLCVKGLRDGVDLERLRQLIASRASPELPILVCDTTRASAVLSPVRRLALTYKLRQLLRPIFDELGAKVLPFAGDDFAAFFEDPTDCMLAAVAARRAVLDWNSLAPDSQRIQVHFCLGLNSVFDDVVDPCTKAKTREPFGDPFKEQFDLAEDTAGDAEILVAPELHDMVLLAVEPTRSTSTTTQRPFEPAQFVDSSSGLNYVRFVE